MERRVVAVSTVVVLVLSVFSAAQAEGAATRHTKKPAVTRLSTTTGALAGGSRVTVNGRGFMRVTAVMFGRTRAPRVSRLSSRRLVVTTPRHLAGRVDVRVVIKRGHKKVTSARRPTDRFTYVSPPAVTGMTPAAGTVAGGNRVVIRGRNLLAISAAVFGSTRVAVRQLDRTRLAVTAPRHRAGAVAVRLTGRYGTSVAAAASLYTFRAPVVAARPAVTGVSPSKGSTAGGTTVTVSGTSLSTNAVVRFGATSATVISATSTQVVVTSPAHSAGTVDFQITTSTGTSATSTSDRYEFETPPQRGSLAGSVTHNSAPLSGVDVVATPSVAGSSPVYALTSAAGRYSLGDLAPGSYVVCFFPSDGAPEYCRGDAASNDISPVVVSGGGVTDVDASFTRSGSVTGKVTAESGGAAIDGALVQVESVTDPSVAATATTATDGTYSVTGVSDGTYRVCVIPRRELNGYAEACWRGSDSSTSISITSASTSSSINVTLPSRGSIAGRVTSADGGAGIEGIGIVATPSADARATPIYTSTGEDGTYLLDGLIPADYQVCFETPQSSIEHYADTCFGEQTGAAGPSDVTVSGGTTTGSVDGELTRTAGISGTVTVGDTRAPLSGALVSLYSTNSGTSQVDVTTDDNGNFVVGDLPAGDYAVCVSHTDADVRNYVDGCRNGSDEPPTADGTDVSVTAGADLTGIDLTMVQGGAAAGTVRSFAGNAAVTGVVVELHGQQSGETRYATSAVDGRWRLSSLPADTYSACFYPTAKTPTDVTSTCLSGDDSEISVSAFAEVTGVDVAMHSAAKIAGRVVDGNGNPVGGAEVDAFPQSGSGAQVSTTTGDDGRYSLAGLTADSYLVCAYPAGSDDGTCWTGPPDNPASSPQPIDVNEGDHVDSIDMVTQS